MMNLRIAARMNKYPSLCDILTKDFCMKISTISFVQKVLTLNHEKHIEGVRTAAEVTVGFVDTDFIVNLVLFHDILRKSSVTENYLQSKEMDTAKAVELITALKANLQREYLFEEVWIRVVQLIKKHDIASPIEHRRRRCREDSNQRIWTKDDYKVELFDTVIGEFVKELDIRCYDEASCILKTMTAMNPMSKLFSEF